MKASIRIVCILAVLLTATNAMAERAVLRVLPELWSGEGFDPKDSAGLFVGVREFDHQRFVEVPFAVDDAVDLAHLFVFDLRLLTPGKVVLSLAGEPQKKETVARLKELLAAGARQSPALQTDIYRLVQEQGQRTGESGLFIVTLATHGLNDPTEGDFLVASSSLHERISRTGISVKELFDDVSKAKAPRRLVLIDACRERVGASRSGEGEATASMSRSFHDAIQEATGQLILSSTTIGGFSYDDFEIGNGVFTAAAIDGLRGRAPSDARGFITLRTLADYINERVRAWIADHRPDHVDVSQGISQLIEGTMADMPLAVDGSVLRQAEDYRRRRDAALAHLREHLDPATIPGALYDEITAALAPDLPGPRRVALIEEIEALDGSVRLGRNLARYFEENREAILADEPDSFSYGRYTDPAVGLDFSLIEPGSFQMGSPVAETGRDSDEHLHTVKLERRFWISTTEVTRHQFELFVEATDYVTEAENRGWSLVWNGTSWEREDGISWRDAKDGDHPAVHVSWNDALAFCAWLGERLDFVITLPTEAEWEYAARAGSDGATYVGQAGDEGCEADALAEIAWYCGNSRGARHRVGLKTPNDLRLHDMLGNVAEWVEDAAEWDATDADVITPTYVEGIADPRSADGPLRVVRGGSWDSSAPLCRAASRFAFDPSFGNDLTGFRVIRIQR